MKHYLYKLNLPYFNEFTPAVPSITEEQGPTTSILLPYIPDDFSEEIFRAEFSRIPSEYTLKFFTIPNRLQLKSAILTFKTVSASISAFNLLNGSVDSLCSMRSRSSKAGSSSSNSFTTITTRTMILQPLRTRNLLLCEKK